MNVILDTNIWISFLFGKHLASVKSLFENKEVHVYVSQALIAEISSVVSRPKIKNHISQESIDDMWSLIKTYCEEIECYPDVIASVRDVKDVYLLSMAKAIPADIIVTGDMDLLVLQQFQKTQILSYSDFIFLLQGITSKM